MALVCYLLLGENHSKQCTISASPQAKALFSFAEDVGVTIFHHMTLSSNESKNVFPQQIILFQVLASYHNFPKILPQNNQDASFQESCQSLPLDLVFAVDFYSGQCRSTVKNQMLIKVEIKNQKLTNKLINLN